MSQSQHGLQPGDAANRNGDRIGLLASLLESLPIGVVAMNADTEVVFYNQYEERLAGRSRENVLGQRFFEKVAPCTQVAHLEQIYLDGMRSAEFQHTLDFRFPRPFVDQPRDVRLTLQRLGLGENSLGLLLVEDVSSIRAVERTKDFLVRSMAHDMSSPLSAAQASLELFTLEENPAEGRLLLDASRTSLMRLRDMLENLYGIAELHTAGLQLQPAATDLGALTQEVVKMYKARSARKGLTLTCSVTDVVTAEVDPDTVRRALGNLLDNAVDYTPQGGLIRVRTEGLGTRCLVEVADDGPGIPAHLLGQIRQPFVRGSTAKISEAGTHRGLGLAFVDLVAREHGGELLIECPEAGGSIFTLMLPVEPPARR